MKSLFRSKSKDFSQRKTKQKWVKHALTITKTSVSVKCKLTECLAIEVFKEICERKDIGRYRDINRKCIPRPGDSRFEENMNWIRG